MKTADHRSHRAGLFIYLFF